MSEHLYLPDLVVHSRVSGNRRLGSRKGIVQIRQQVTPTRTIGPFKMDVCYIFTKRTQDPTLVITDTTYFSLNSSSVR